MNVRSLRFQLIAWHAGLLTSVYILFAVAMFLGSRLLLERNLLDSQVRRAQQIANTLVREIEPKGAGYVSDEIKARYAPELNSRYVRIVRADGKVIYASGLPQDGSFDPRPLANSPVPEATVRSRKQRLAGAKDLLIASTPANSDSGAKFVVEAGAPLEPIYAVLKNLRFWLGLGLPVVVGVSILGGYILVQRALSPVDQICESAERISSQNLSQRLPVSQTADELQRLSLSLNHMITRLDEAFQHNRRFMADASHEMRTPLTVLRGELESLLNQRELSVEVCESLESILEEVQRLTMIVESLFALARLDAGEGQAKWAEVDLSRLASSTAEQMCLLAADKQIQMNCEAPEPVPVQGDRARLKQIVVNLLDNAIKYTPPGGNVTLKVATAQNKALLEVIDSGIGIPPSEQKHVFERFFRVDKARSREMGGAGLGLAIVKSICTAHGGQVDLESIEGSGSRFRIELPLAAASENRA